MSSRIARPRRGAVAVLVVAMLVVLLGCTAFAIDFGRRFAFKAELQTVADASAMAGALEVLHRRPLAAPDSATAYGALNPVESTAGVLDTIEPGFFTDDDGFTPLASWGDPSVNAVRTTARYTVNYIFAPVVGVTSGTIVAQAIGAIGAQTTSSCLKPWAVPMDNVLYALGKTGENPETYDLTPADVNHLRDHQVPIMFKVSTQNDKNGKRDEGSNVDALTNQPISGNFYAVQYGPVRDVNGNLYSPGPVSGGNTYRERIAGTCDSFGVKPGDWLQVENGNMVGPTGQGSADLCGLKGNPKNFLCTKEV
ncbi:MAG TPA: pilus assembly protein TadG-related protein, partial [Gemmatimonadaceae bacterium]|nr:pilus assembly protein TadG-related protein [Gemmatimonadaceae bacterium]